jgi:hypothetical protein
MTSPTAATTTLDELMSRKSSELGPHDIEQIVDGLRAQSDQWNANQNTGSRKRVTTANIALDKDGPKVVEKKKRVTKDAVAKTGLMDLKL